MDANGADAESRPRGREGCAYECAEEDEGADGGGGGGGGVTRGREDARRRSGARSNARAIRARGGVRARVVEPFDRRALSGGGRRDSDSWDVCFFSTTVRLSSSRGRGSAAAMAQPSAKSATAPMNDVIGRVGFGDAGASRARVAVRSSFAKD